MADLARIKRNVAKMAGMNAPEADIDGYIESEGVTVEGVRNFKPQSVQPSQTNPLDPLNAFFTGTVNAIPIAGPPMMSALERLKASVHRVPVETISAEEAGARDRNPIATMSGEVTGTVAPFLVGGAIPGVARLLGMSGGLGSRVALGLGSGSAISAADTAVRGGDAQEIFTSGVVGGALGGTLPFAEKAIGAGLRALTGRTVPKEATNVARALRDDQIPVAEVNKRLTEMGPGSMVMDLGPNLQRQAGAVASVPGTGQKLVRDAVAARSKGAAGRVTADVAATLGTGPELSTQRATGSPAFVSPRSMQQWPGFIPRRNYRRPSFGRWPALLFLVRTPCWDQQRAGCLRLRTSRSRSQFTVGANRMSARTESGVLHNNTNAKLLSARERGSHG